MNSDGFRRLKKPVEMLFQSKNNPAVTSQALKNENLVFRKQGWKNMFGTDPASVQKNLGRKMIRHCEASFSSDAEAISERGIASSALRPSRNDDLEVQPQSASMSALPL